MKESINTPISVKNNIDTVNETKKSQASNKTVDTPKINKTEKLIQYINQGLLKELTQKTQLINQGLF